MRLNEGEGGGKKKKKGQTKANDPWVYNMKNQKQGQWCCSVRPGCKNRGSKRILAVTYERNNLLFDRSPQDRSQTAILHRHEISRHPKMKYCSKKKKNVYIFFFKLEDLEISSPWNRHFSKFTANFLRRAPKPGTFLHFLFQLKNKTKE